MGRLVLPGKLVAAAEAEGRRDWLATALPTALGQALKMWSLTVGEPFQPGGLDPQRVLLWLFARCVQESPQWPPLAAVARSLAP